MVNAWCGACNGYRLQLCVAQCVYKTTQRSNGSRLPHHPSFPTQVLSKKCIIMIHLHVFMALMDTVVMEEEEEEAAEEDAIHMVVGVVTVLTVLLLHKLLAAMEVEHITDTEDITASMEEDITAIKHTTANDIMDTASVIVRDIMDLVEELMAAPVVAVAATKVTGVMAVDTPAE
ncbi:hypothetical protein CK203_055197 [Vitis vinifera]|uniref:Uncharacterized protein n=2 Tax=Vitis vinifera TaxID=29760 RepID=A0A438GHS0_VITVI|nr:hypothetical protein CK203_055197 [Vitis vinifera]